jgi:hypothetical protein
MHPTEETLNHYVDGGLDNAVHAQVEQHLETCADCALVVAWLQHIMAAVRSLPQVSPPAQLWTRLAAQLAQAPADSPRLRPDAKGHPGRSWRPLWALATAALVVLAFLTGRVVDERHRAAESQQTNTQGFQPANLSASAKVRERVLLIAVGDHLERSQLVLVELANRETSGELDISAERQSADELLASNRLYRQTAAEIGQTNIAGVLDDLERVLVEVARGPSQISIEQLADLQQRIEAQGLLFKVKIIGSKVRERAKPVS